MSSNSALFALALAVLLEAPAGAATGETAAAFLQRPLDAQRAAMGSTGAALYGRAASVQFNPAANAFLSSREAATSYLAAPGGGQFGFLGYAHPTFAGTLTGSLVYFNAGSIDLDLSNGERRTVTAEEDLAVGGAYAVTLLPGLAAGAGVRWIRMSLAGTARATAGLADLGALWRGSGALQGLSAGAAWQNLGRDIKFESVGDPPPTTVRGGLAYTTGVFPARKIDPGDDVDLDATIAADAVKVAREGLSPRLGLELGLHPDFLQRAALRFGWVFNRPGENLTAGLGLRTGRFFVDYAVGAGDLGAVHQISVATSF